MSVLDSVQRCLGACAVLAAGALAAPAAAQVTPIGPFVGQFSDGFEGPGVSPFGVPRACYSPPANPLFGGTAQLCARRLSTGATFSGLAHLSLTAVSSCPVSSFEGSNYVRNVQDALVFEFNNDGAGRFGGYITANNNNTLAAGGTVEFRDENEVLIGTGVLDLGPCGNPGWKWHGWEIPGAAKTVWIYGNDGTANIALDAMEYDVGVPGGCYPDCDGNTVLDFFDFLCFQNAFLAGDPYADCDGNTFLDFFDFLCFQNEFLAGCQ